VRKQIAIVVLVLSCFAGWAQQQNFFDTVSPKLNKFLASNPAAYKTLTNALTETFSTNSLLIHYFYSGNEAEARAYHFYPQVAGMPDVIICVRENQTALDEYISILFEAINARGQPRFLQLVDAAKSGTISRNDFVHGILKIEFEATKAIKELLISLKLSRKDCKGSYFYDRFANGPTTYEEHRAYVKKVSPQRDAIGHYEKTYDELRNAVKEPEVKAVP
jgi:hypothetical protein